MIFGYFGTLTDPGPSRTSAASAWDEYYDAAKYRWREVRDGGVPSITVVAAQIDDLIKFARRHGGSPTDATTERRYR